MVTAGLSGRPDSSSAEATASGNNEATTAPTPLPPQTVDSDWMYQYQRLVQYKLLANTTAVPDDGTYLSQWVEQQHVEYSAFIRLLEGRGTSKDTKNSMNETKLRLLRELGFIFEQRPDPKDEKARLKWEAKVNLLRKYRDKHGHINVPTDYDRKNNLDPQEEEDAREFRGLGAWLSTARRKIRQKDAFWTPARVQTLRDLGIHTEPLKRGTKRQRTERSTHQQRQEKKRQRLDVKWEKKFAEMKEFVEKEGHSIVPSKPPYTALRGWFQTQRNEYKKLREGQPSLMTACKLQRLTDIGFVFVAKNRFTFEERLQQWQKYRALNNGKDPLRYSEDGLGKWISTVREKKNLNDEGKKTNLSKEQEDLLTGLGFTWQVIKRPEKRSEVKSWDQRFAELEEYRKENGDILVPQTTPGLGGKCCFFVLQAISAYSVCFLRPVSSVVIALHSQISMGAQSTQCLSQVPPGQEESHDG